MLSELKIGYRPKQNIDYIGLRYFKLLIEQLSLIYGLFSTNKTSFNEILGKQKWEF
jgi:hypothetical protein